VLSFQSDNNNFTFAHLLDTGHAIGPIYKIMKIIHTTNKGSHINTLQKYHTCIPCIYIYIYMETKKLNQINDKTNIIENKIYDKIDKYETP
jgi:hypothetical protein